MKSSTIRNLKCLICSNQKYESSKINNINVLWTYFPFLLFGKEWKSYL